MAASKTETAKFSILVDSNASKVAGDTKTSVEGLASSIKASEQRIKDLMLSVRNLRGSSDEVKNAKEGLKAALDAERNKISQSEIGLRKLGTTTADLAAKERVLAKSLAEKEKAEKDTGTKKAAAETKGMAEALKNAGGPVANITNKLESLKTVLGGGGKAGVLLGLAGVATLAVAGVSALASLGAKLGGLVVDAGKFVIVSANLARAAQLNREAFLGNAKDASALGSQIDRLARKLPKTKEELNALAQGLSESGVSGKALVDSLEAVAGAGTEKLAGTLKNILDAAKVSRRIVINRPELVGTGLSFDDVAKELSVSMKIGVDDAKRALASGRVGLSVGAEALKNAVNKKFGEINARKMLDLDVQASKFKERLAGLASGVKLEPLLKSLDSMSELLDESTMTGAALKDLATAFGNEIVGGIKNGTPAAKAFFKGVVIGALELGTEYYKLKKSLKSVFSASSIDSAKTLNIALASGKAVAGGLAVSVGTLALALAGGAAAAYAMVTPFVYLYKGVTALQRIGWKGIGTAIIDGFVSGITSGFSSVKGAILGLGETAKAALKKSLGIASPSKVFAGYGKNTADGYVDGVESGHGDAAAATKKLGATQPSGAGQGFGSSAGGRARLGAPEIHVHIHAGDKASANDIVAKITSPAVMNQITRAIENAMTGGGMLSEAAA